jgi:hypothetical protein
MRVSLVVLIAGLVQYSGWRYLKGMAFPIVFLLFMIPWPTIILNASTLSLAALGGTPVDSIVTADEFASVSRGERHFSPACDVRSGGSV